MDVVLYLLLVALSGLVVGALARLALPGRDPMSLLQTMAVGIAGSFAAGIVALLVSAARGLGLLLSVAFATLLVYLVRRARGGTLTRPPGDPRVRPSG